MINDWGGTARAIIAHVDAALPDGADLKARKHALNEAKPWEFRVTSWGRKVWAKSARQYLEKHGLPPLKPPPATPLLSPLDRAKAASERNLASRQGMADEEK